MHLLRLACICGVLWHTCIAIKYQHEDRRDTLDSSTDTRRKRGLRDIFSYRSPIWDGIRGTRNILKGAVPKYHSLTYHEYAKFGGYEAALKDFRALKPRNVKTELHDSVRETEGMIGNRRMVLSRALTSSGNTSIKIYKRKQLKIQINYHK